MDICAIGRTDTGKVRLHNEDSHEVMAGTESPGDTSCVMIVADGMGGHAAGEIASEMAVRGLVKIMEAESAKTAELDNSGYSKFLSEALKLVNTTVYDAGRVPDKAGMGTTCTTGVIRRNQLLLAHVGDSRAYLFRSGKLSQLTTDHSWVEEAVARGLLAREDARIHPNRNVITRAIGLDPDIAIDLQALSVETGDTVLLCSDGLNSMIPDSQIENIFLDNSFEEIPQLLIDSANEQGGDDNITVLLAQVH